MIKRNSLPISWAGSIGKCKFSEKFEELLFWCGETEFFYADNLTKFPNGYQIRERKFGIKHLLRYNLTTRFITLSDNRY